METRHFNKTLHESLVRIPEDAPGFRGHSILNRIISLFMLAVIFLLMPVRAPAQEQSDQLQLLLDLQKQSWSELVEEDDEEVEPVPGSDRRSSDLGRQRLLRRKEPHQPFLIGIRSGAQYTDNARNVSNNPESDYFNSNEFRTGLYPESIGNFSYGASLSYQTVDYFDDVNKPLNFNLFQGSLSANYRLFPKQLNLGLNGRYRYQRMSSSEDRVVRISDGFLTRHVLTAGINRPFQPSPYHRFFMSFSTDVETTIDAQEDFLGNTVGGLNDTEKTSYNLMSGYTYEFSRMISFNMMYALSRKEYSHLQVSGGSSREDTTQTVSLSPRIGFTRNFVLEGALTYTDNSSNSDIQEYSALNGGINLSYNYKL